MIGHPPSAIRQKICILSSVHIALDNRVFYREACSLRRAGYSVTLIAVHPRDEVKDGVQIVALPRVPRWRRPLLWLRLVRMAVAARADAYHFHDPELLLVTPWLRLVTRKPVVYDVHESYPEFVAVKEYLPTLLRAAIAWLLRWLEPALARLQSALIFSDDQIALAFQKVRLPKATLYNFPESSFIDQALAVTQAGPLPSARGHPPTVLYLGGLERNRGSRLMAEAFQRVRQDVPEARLHLVGHFEPAVLERELRSDATRLGFAGALDVTERVPFEHIGGYLRRATVGWLPWQPVPKNQKNVPTKLFEYMAYGLPVVVSELLSTRPFVQNGQNGYLVPSEDPAAHAEAIVRLLRDPLAAAAMGRVGQERVRTQWNWGEMEQRLLGLYEELLGAPASLPALDRLPSPVVLVVSEANPSACPRANPSEAKEEDRDAP